MFQNCISQQLKSGNETINKHEDTSEQSKGGNQGNNDVDNYEIVTESVKSGKESKSDNLDSYEIINEKVDSGGRHKKQKIPNVMMNLVLICDISDTSTSTSIIQDGNMDHQSAPITFHLIQNWKML